MPEARTIGGLLAELARRAPEAEALVGGGRRLTFADLHAEARALAKDLHALGLRRGDRIALLMGNRPEWLLVDFAATMLGAVLVAVNTWSTARELQHVLRQSGASVLVTADRFLKSDFLALLDELRPWGETLPTLRHVIVHGEGARADTIPFAALRGRGAAMTDADLDALAASVQPEDTAYILYTSGSTAAPKAVLIRHRSLVENMWGIGERLGIVPGDRVWLAVSLFWGLGCENALFAAYTHGAALVLQEHFDAGEALALIEAERCTTLYAMPNMVHALLEHPDRARRDLSSVRKGATLGSPAQMRRAIEALMPEACQIYGLTETYGNCAVTPSTDPVELRCTTVGPALPGNRIRIADPATGAELPPGEVGEIRVKGHVTPGYHDDPARTEAAFDAEGWFVTGDLGSLDATGRLRFHGRIKEMVKTGGINVAPAEVEEVLHAHPAVEQAYVVGLPDPVRDELLVAVVVLQRGAAATPEALAAHCRAALAAYKVPRRILVVAPEALPLTVTGKVQKNRIGALFGAQPG